MATSARELLLQHYLDWQKSEGRLRTLKDFAALCELNESYLNLVMNGKRPFTLKLAIKMAQIFDDRQFYDALDLPRPDPDFQTLSRLWPRLPEETRQSLRKQAEQYAAENEARQAKERPSESHP